MPYAPLESLDLTLAAGADTTEFGTVRGRLVAVDFPTGIPGTTATLLAACDLCPDPAEVRRTDGTAYTFTLGSLPARWVIPEELRDAVASIAFRFDAPAAAQTAVRVYMTG